MRNRTLILGMCILLLPIAFAIDEGDTYTQQQLDNFNVDNINRVLLKCESERNIYRTDNFFYTPYTCLDFEYHEDAELYYVFRGTYYVAAPVWYIKLIYQMHGEAIARQAYWDGFAKPQFKQTIQYVKDKVLYYQTDDFDDEIINWTGDLW